MLFPAVAGVWCRQAELLLRHEVSAPVCGGKECEGGVAVAVRCVVALVQRGYGYMYS